MSELGLYTVCRRSLVDHVVLALGDWMVAAIALVVLAGAGCSDDGATVIADSSVVDAVPGEDAVSDAMVLDATVADGSLSDGMESDAALADADLADAAPADAAPIVFPGSYSILPTISYACASTASSYSASQFTLSTPVMLVATGLIQKGTPFPLGGLLPVGETFTASGSVIGAISGCSEAIELTGTFTGADTWQGQFTVDYSGSCLDCVDLSVAITGTRN